MISATLHMSSGRDYKGVKVEDHRFEILLAAMDNVQASMFKLRSPNGQGGSIVRVNQIESIEWVRVDGNPEE